MDELLQALANEGRREILRELRRSPGSTHTELRERLGIPKARGGTLSKRIDELENAGLVAPSGARYEVVDSETLGRLLSAAARLNASALGALVQRTQAAIPAAQRLAEELENEERQGDSE